MDLTTARTRLAGRGFDYLTTDQIDEALNTAKNNFEDAYPWPWLETSTTNTAPVTISDLKQVLYVVDTSHDVPLSGNDIRTLAEWDPGLATTGDPQYWYLDGLTSLKVWPVNTSASLEVRYVKESPELANGDDEPLIPDRYCPIWLDLAVAECLKITNNYAASQAQENAANARILQLIDRYSERNLQNGDPQTIYGYSEDW